MLSAPFVSLVLALASIVSGVHAYDIEPRNGGNAIYEELLSRSPQGGAAFRTAMRPALRAGRGTARVAYIPRPPPAPPAQPASASSTTKAAKAGALAFFGTKVAAGTTVGVGSLLAQNVDGKLDARDLERRQGVGRIARLGAQSVRAARPTVSHVRPPRLEPKFGKLKAAGVFTATALTAGAGEYHGGKQMGNAIDRLEQADAQKRELYEELLSRSPQGGVALGRVAGPVLRAGRNGVSRGAPRVGLVRPSKAVIPRPATAGGSRSTTQVSKAGDLGFLGAIGRTSDDRHDQADTEKRELYEELLSRSPQTGAALSRVAGPVIRGAGRSGALRGAKPVLPRPPSTPHQTPSSGVGRKLGKATVIATAAASGGFLEGMVQNITPEVQEKLRQNPKDTISKMLPANTFGGRKREYVEDLVTRGGSSLEPVERLMARAVVDMLLDDM